MLLFWLVAGPVFRSFTQDSFYEFQAPALTASSYIKDIQSYWTHGLHSKDDLIAAGRDLARRNAAYLMLEQENAALHREIRGLEELLQLPSRQRYRYEIARVARRDVGSWWQNIIIRKGENYNIPEGAAVIYRGGVVGRVTEVYAHTSKVELVSSPRFRMAATVEGDLRPVIYQGRPNSSFSAPKGEVRDVPPDIMLDNTRPLRLVSSELGGVFPQGLPIGEITQLEIGTDGLFKEGDIQLDKELLNLREVAIVIPIEPAQSDDF